IARWLERLRRHPGDSEAWTSLGDTVLQRGRETADVTSYGLAERVYRRALELDPREVGALVGMGSVCNARHEFERSTEWEKKALALDDGKPEAYGLLGDAAVEMGDYHAAFRHYQKMMDLRPDLASYSRGAHLLFLMGDSRGAGLLMRQAIAAGSPYAENVAWCRAQLALITWNTGAYPAAEELLTAALQEAPRNPHLLAAMGKVKAARKDYAAAIDCYRQAVAIVPQVDSLVALGDLYQVTGKKREAEEQYVQVEAIHRLNRANGVRGDMQLALFYANHDRSLAEALRLAQEEYRTRRNVFAADALAWCLYKNARCREASETIGMALARRTPDANFYYHAGMIYSKLGDRPHAQ